MCSWKLYTSNATGRQCIDPGRNPLGSSCLANLLYYALWVLHCAEPKSQKTSTHTIGQHNINAAKLHTPTGSAAYMYIVPILRVYKHCCTSEFQRRDVPPRGAYIVLPHRTRVLGVQYDYFHNRYTRILKDEILSTRINNISIIYATWCNGAPYRKCVRRFNCKIANPPAPHIAFGAVKKRPSIYNFSYLISVDLWENIYNYIKIDLR